MLPARMLADHEYQPIALLDLAAEGPTGRRDLDAVRDSLNRLGFLLVRHDAIQTDRLRRCFDLAKQFFALPAEEKEELNHTGIDQKQYGNIGYYKFNTETAVGSKVPDLKEFLHIGVGDFVPATMEAVYPKNKWPREIPEFQNEFSALFRQLYEGAMIVLRAVGDAYGCDWNYLKQLVEDGNSILRVIHYPPAPIDVPGAAMRAAPHTGINMLGLQPPSTSAGLQFCKADGEWVALNRMEPSWVTVNIGEMFSRVLGEAVRPTLHRVVNAQNGSEKVDRYTIVYFFHANPLRKLMALPRRDGTKAQDVKVGDWLLERLRQIGMKDKD